MRIDIVYPNLPPEVDGIGDHTAILAAALASEGHRVRLLSRGVASVSTALDAEVVPVWKGRRRAEGGALVKAILSSRPDVVLLQFEQFAYGRRGFNPGVALSFLALRLIAPNIRRVLVAHENYVDRRSFRHTLMWLYQRPQFLALVRNADAVVMTTAAWMRPRDTGRARADVVPVFSNIPHAGVARARARRVLGLEREGRVVIWFGNLDGERAQFFAAAANVLRGSDVSKLVYVGTGSAIARRIASEAGLPLLDLGEAPHEAVSVALTAADIGLAPFPDGVTTRRGSFLAQVQHGLATATTLGPDTDPSLLSAFARGCFAASPAMSPESYAEVVERLARADALAIEQMGTRAQEWYAESFSPRLAAERILAAIEEMGPPASGTVGREPSSSSRG